MENQSKPRTLVVGDLHGCYRGLKQALVRCKFDYVTDKLIFLGDYVDGWSESANLIQLLIDLQTDSKRQHVFLRGNHDKDCQDWLTKGYLHANKWTEGQGKSTVASYVKTNYIESPLHKQFFKNLKNFYVDHKNRAFVHAGFTSKLGVGHEPYESNHYFDRDLWSLAVLLDKRYVEGSEEVVARMRRFLVHKEVYIGHTPTHHWNVRTNTSEYDRDEQKLMGPITVPMNRCNVWNMDTGAGFKGPVTIMDIKSKRIWQSDRADKLYPDEKGRN